MGAKKDMKKYEVNEKVLCKHGQYYYEAKIIEIAEEDGETVYIVHYQVAISFYFILILYSVMRRHSHQFFLVLCIGMPRVGIKIR
ncbi:hypothetical protein ANCDUO_26689 [Ancylostoma duodenale]|uniref:Tudor-knot domain-containing protein n=1 Tax=Ancylostoma duodenale TaxID=51022 RepID=A0A0C2BHS2_9BILA|nr:hypothetical protein ANCDUO_26689 [Ancylostoma duodenale]